MPRNIILTDTLPGADPVEFVTPGSLPRVISELPPGDYRVYSALAFSTGTVTAAPGALRTASTQSTVSMHIGHSLTDDYFAGNPGQGEATMPMYYLRDWQFDDGAGVSDHLIGATLPGAPIRYHWSNPSKPWGEWGRTRMNEVSCAVITQGTAFDGTVGPNETDPTRQTLWLLFLENLLNFAEHAHVYGNDGAGAEIILYSNWVEIDTAEPGGFRGMLDHQEESYHTAADYVTWKMHQLYPSLPANWRVWVAPGHEVMKRLYDYHQATGLPGITDFDDIFFDNIHGDHTADYALACMVYTMMYQTDLATPSDVWVTPQIAGNTAFADLVQQMAQDIVSESARAGMGGTEYGLGGWDDATETDPFPTRTAIANPSAPIFGEWPQLTRTSGGGEVGSVYAVNIGTALGQLPITTTWTLELDDGSTVTDVTGDVSGGEYTSTAEGDLILTVDLSNGSGTAQRMATEEIANAGALPTAVFEMTPTGYTGPALTGTLPAASGGYRTLTAADPAPISAALSLSQTVHITMAVRSGSLAGAGIALLSLNAGAYGSTPRVVVLANGFLGDWHFSVHDSTYNETTSGAGLNGTWQVIEMWAIDGDGYVSVDGGTPSTFTTSGDDVWATANLYLARDEGSGGDTIDVAAMRIMEGTPSAAERQALRDWADDIIAGIPA